MSQHPTRRRAKPLLQFFDDYGIAHSSGRHHMKHNPAALPKIVKIGGRFYVFDEDEEEWRRRQIAPVRVESGE